MNYIFFITIGATTTQVYPLNFLSSSIDSQKESGQVFYRRKFNGSLTFYNNSLEDDYDLIKAADTSDPCAKILFEIKNNGSTYWEGYFAPSDGNFDLDKKLFTVTPQLDDDYNDMLDKADDQYNLVALNAVTTTAILGVINVSYTRNRWIYNSSIAPNLNYNVLEYLADKIKTGVTVSSTFFSNATNPATLSANKLKYLTIAQKSDIIRPNSTNAASVAMLSWNELMDILWAMFEVKWDYNPLTNTINVEHISFWQPTAGMDLTTQALSKNNKYSYLKEEMPKYEKYAFMEALNGNFVGHPIWYDSKCVDQDPDSNSVETSIPVTTDLQYIIDNPLEIADDGFVILCNRLQGGNYYVDVSCGAFPYTVIGLNMHLSWVTLHSFYHRHNRVLIEGYLNDQLTTFWSAKKTKFHECYAKVCPADGFDPNDYLTTELGNTLGVKASVKSASLKPTGEMKFGLVYGPEDTVQTAITDYKGIVIEQDDTCFTFNAYLTEPAPVGGLVVHLTETIRDENGDVVCTGNEETWTIAAGKITDSYTMTPCLAIPSGGCVDIAYDVPVDWIADFNYDMTNCACQ